MLLRTVSLELNESFSLVFWEILKKKLNSLLPCFYVTLALGSFILNAFFLGSSLLNSLIVCLSSVWSPGMQYRLILQPGTQNPKC